MRDAHMIPRAAGARRALTLSVSTALGACTGGTGGAPDGGAIDARADVASRPDAAPDAAGPDVQVHADASSDSATDATVADVPDPCLGHTCSCTGGTRGDLLGLQQQFPSDVTAFDALVGRLDAYGTRWIRMYWMWPWVEGSRGNRNFAPIQAAVTAAHSRGMKILVLATGAPTWANGGQAQDYPPTAANIADYANYAAAMATETGPDAIEIWNEPNNQGFWASGPNAAQWAHMQVAAYAAIKAARPETIVVTGGLTQVATQPQTFFSAALAADPAFIHSFDAVGLHPYNEPADPLAPGGYPNILTVQLPAIQRMLAAQGRGDVPFWMTEYGVATSGMYSVSEAAQATYLQHFFDGLATLRSSGVHIGVSILYMLEDWNPYGTSTSEQPYFGILRSDGSAKPAAATVRTFATMPCS